jgi:hypothetical protein
MRNQGNLISRRDLAKLAAGASIGTAFAAPTPLFNGRTLDGWLQIENSAFSFSTADLNAAPGFLAKIAGGQDRVSEFLRSQPRSPEVPALAKDLSKIVAGASIYDPQRFSGVVLRPETEALLKSRPSGYQLARLNKMLLEDAYPNDLARSVTTGWVVKDGAMASTGVGRGVIYTEKDYGRFHLTFTMRHVSGNPDHQACVLIFCSRPGPNEKPLDALGGIQFQVPNGGHWDYRPSMNNNGGSEFTSVNKTHFDVHEWSRVEIVADSTKGEARMSVAQPPDSAPVEVLAFKDPAAGKAGPIAWQMHNAGLLDEYKEVSIEFANMTGKS